MDPKQFQALVSKRAGSRGAITRLLTKIQGITKSSDMQRELKYFELGKKLEDLNTKLNLLKALDAEIPEATPNEKIEEEMKNADSVISHASDEYDSASFVAMILKKEIDEITMRSMPHSTGNNNTSNQTGSSNLLKFDLPEFNGDILLWQALSDVFEGEVDSSDRYSAATKFNFLNSRLSGEARALLTGLAPNNTNYPKAVELLISGILLGWY